MRNVSRYVERLRRHRRPHSFVPTDEQAEALTAAIALSGARPEDAMPRPEFVAGLRDRLAADLARAGEDEREPVRRPRRGLLLGTAASAVSAAFGAIVVAVTDRMPGGRSPVVPPAVAATLEPAAGTWHTVLASANLTEGATTGFDTGTVAGFLTRTGGTVTARSGVCTHQGCRLNLSQGRLACPCHRTFFHLDGTVIASQLPTPPARLPAIQAREHEGAIQIYVP
jgi:cytochrome b6-f complex iron-sulfur subunit